ncbi:MAG TPA: geranylgeranylglyceryl/heptaprenylglyceryl phosphate synthase [Chitinophagales bacterium]|nr:geranylgeranylglyceryl/heptaprenylglyceryl phosphate synthase [Chitinophagales bacterium]
MEILSRLTGDSKLLAILIDPDKCNQNQLSQLSEYAQQGWIHLFLIGGSLLFKNQVKEIVDYLKENCNVPVIIFPGNPSQIYDGADGLFLLSLISGRNADLLIGRHVEAAPSIKQSGLEVIPTGYILIDGGKATSVSYMSNTTPIPSDKADIAVATAIAGELLGLKSIYLEAGSGANHPVSSEIIQRVCNSVDIPVIVGGGIRSVEQVEKAFDSGAQVVVIGTAVEEYPDFIPLIATSMKNYA